MRRRLRSSLAESSSSRVVSVPNGVDLDYFHPVQSSPEPETILFSGKISYHANEAAALQLAQRIMPVVWERAAEREAGDRRKGSL